MQDRHDADVAVFQPAPIGDVVPAAAEVAVDAEGGRDGAGEGGAAFDLGDGFEEPVDILLGSGVAPAVARLAEDLARAMRGRTLDADGHAPQRRRDVRPAAGRVRRSFGGHMMQLRICCG